MQGSIAQIVALVIYGNASLLRAEAGRDFYPSNSTFRFCEFVNFVDLQKENAKWAELPFASDPLQWFERLRRENVATLRMAYGPSGQAQTPDRMLVGFVGGGGRWVLEAKRSGLSDFWEARWQLGDRTRADKKIWRVTYARIAQHQPPIRSEGLEDLKQISIVLDRQLIEIETFARAQKLDSFAKLFQTARSRLDSQPPYPDLYHSDLIRAEFLPTAACQLLAACQDAWVFGGMGSWNDLGFDSAMQPRYEQLSEQLYQLLNRAIIAAANSSAYGTFT